MRILKAVLLSLILKCQARERINERPIRRKIKINIFKSYLYSDLAFECLRIEPEVVIKNLIAARKFEDACECVCIEFGVEITEYCYGRLFPYVPNPREDAEEIAQQVFLEFWRILNAGKYDPDKGSVHGLLLTIAERRAIGRRRTRNRIVPGRDTGLSELDRRNVQASYSRNPELIVLEAQESKILNREVKCLSFAERQIIHLRYTLGHSIDKIAQFTGEKRGTIASRISRACAKLRAVCNSDY